MPGYRWRVRYWKTEMNRLWYPHICALWPALAISTHPAASKFTTLRGLPGCPVVRDPSANSGDAGSIPVLGVSPEGGNGNPLWHCCLENPMDRGAWWAIVHGVAKSLTWLYDWVRASLSVSPSPQAFLPHTSWQNFHPFPPVWETAEVKTWQPGLLAWLVQVSPLVSAAAPCSPVSLPSADCGSSFLFSKTSLPQGYHVVEFNVEKMERDISVLLSTQKKVEKVLWKLPGPSLIPGNFSSICPLFVCLIPDVSSC